MKKSKKQKVQDLKRTLRNINMVKFLEKVRDNLNKLPKNKHSKWT